MKPILFILCGFPFAGKTTVAQYMVDNFEVARVSIDDINQERGVWDNEAGMTPEEWQKTYDCAYKRIDSLLGHGVNVIDDSVNFTCALRNNLRKIAEKHNAHVCLIYVDVPIDEVRKRLNRNRQISERNDVRDIDFFHVVDRFEPPVGEEFVHFDGSVSLDQWIENNVSGLFPS